VIKVIQEKKEVEKGVTRGGPWEKETTTLLMHPGVGQKIPTEGEEESAYSQGSAFAEKKIANPYQHSK